MLAVNVISKLKCSSISILNTEMQTKLWYCFNGSPSQIE